MAAEKRGDTGKLEYDFPTHGVCEIKMKGTWYRTTEREFRSFDGPRRYSIPEYTKHRIVEVPMITENYFGPVYVWGTNTTVPYQGTETIISSSLREKFLEGSRQRR